MRHSTESTLRRTLTRLLSHLIPATGRRRKPAAPTDRTTTSGLRLLTHIPAARRHRKPHDEPVLLDDPSPLVRPYLLAHERDAHALEVAA